MEIEGDAEAGELEVPRCRKLVVGTWQLRDIRATSNISAGIVEPSTSVATRRKIAGSRREKRILLYQWTIQGGRDLHEKPEEIRAILYFGVLIFM